MLGHRPVRKALLGIAAAAAFSIATAASATAGAPAQPASSIDAHPDDDTPRTPNGDPDVDRESELEPNALPVISDPTTDHDGFDEFPVVDEFLHQSWPDEPQFVEPQIENRRVRGMRSDYDFVARLVTTPGAAEQVRVYGVVLSDEEEEAWLAARELESMAGDLQAELRSMDGFGGLRLRWSDSPQGIGVGRLEVRATREGLDDVRRAVNKVELRSVIEFTVVEFSVGELNAVADAVNSNDLAPVKSEAQLDLVNELRDLGAVVDVKPRSNSIMAIVAVPEKDRPATRDVPAVNFVVGSSDQLGRSPCTREACGAVRPGVRIENPASVPTGACTLGFAVRFGYSQSSNRAWLTAGHCDYFRTRWDAQFLRGTSSSSPLWAYDNDYFIRDRSVDLAGVSLSCCMGFYQNSRADGLVLWEQNWRVTNRIRTGKDASTYTTSLKPHVNVVDGMQVCRAGQNLDACGEVTDPDTPNLVDDFPNPDVLLLNQIDTDLQAFGGDSGGPLFMKLLPSMAVGITSSAIGDPSSNGLYQGSTYSSVSYLEDIHPDLNLWFFTDRRSDFISNLYVTGLGQYSPSQVVHNQHLAQLQPCNATNAAALVDDILTSSEFEALHDMTTTEGMKIRVEKLYWLVMGRESDTVGLNGWVTNLENGMDWQTVVNSFTSSSEFVSRVWNGASSYDGRLC